LELAIKMNKDSIRTKDHNLFLYSDIKVILKD